MFKLNVKKVRLLIAEHGWTAKDLARRAGVAESISQQLIRGSKATVQGRVLRKICDALGVNVESILDLEA